MTLTLSNFIHSPPNVTFAYFLSIRRSSCGKSPVFIWVWSQYSKYCKTKNATEVLGLILKMPPTEFLLPIHSSAVIIISVILFIKRRLIKIMLPMSNLYFAVNSSKSYVNPLFILRGSFSVMVLLLKTSVYSLKIVNSAKGAMFQVPALKFLCTVLKRNQQEVHYQLFRCIACLPTGQASPLNFTAVYVHQN